MKPYRISTALMAIVFLMGAAGGANATRGSLGVLAGLNAGIGVEANTMVRDFAEGFPLALRLAAGYSRREAGNAGDARQIFINDATNGTPEESAWLWELRLDFMYDFGWSESADIYVTGGVRYSMFTANFKFIGGNEDFDITCDQWGVGVGLDGYFNITQNLQFVLSGGLDYYFQSTLKGHDTEYSPDGDDVNPRNDYTYDDAAEAVNEPSWEPRALIGLSYWFGY